MSARRVVGQSGIPLYMIGLLMPYLTVGLGLYVFHSAWTAILSYHVGILLILWIARITNQNNNNLSSLRGGRSPTKQSPVLFFRLDDRGDCFASLAMTDKTNSFRITIPVWKLLTFAILGASAGIAMYFLWPYIFVSPVLTQALEQWGLTRVSWPFFIGYSALVNPWLEELYWRGWLGSATRSPVPNDAFFAGFHLVILAPFISIAWLIVSFVILTSAGWLWRQVTVRSMSLLPATLFHLVADVSILLVIVSEIK